MKSPHHILVAPGLLLLSAGAQAHDGDTIRLAFDIHANQMEEALTEFAEATQLQVLFQSAMVNGQPAPAVSGSLTPEVALQALLADSGLRYEFINARTVTIRTAAEMQTLAEAAAGGSEPIEASSADGTIVLAAEHAPAAASTRRNGAQDAAVRKAEPAEGRSSTERGIPEVLVQSSKILNMDLKRSTDDAQPYVIFERQAIEDSGAATVDELLKQRLTMNTQGISGRQGGGAPGGLSEVNLRGLGANQTLILVDGHRVAGVSYFNGSRQADINGIPLSAVERIEVLPTTASGVYGGSATGGVVNIVMRRDYTGVETKVTYGNTFSSDAFTRRADLNAGFSLEGGKTSILFAGSWAEGGGLEARDRDFLERARQQILANNNGNYDALSTFGVPPLGATPNIRSSNGANLTLKTALGGTNLGSPIAYIPTGYAGLAADGVAPLISTVGKYNTDLANTHQSTGGGLAGLLSEPTVKSGMLTLRRQFTATWQMFLDASASSNLAERPLAFTTNTFTVAAGAQNNPFNQNIQVTVPLESVRSTLVEAKSQRAVLGSIVRLPANWTAEADYTWNRAKYENTATPLSLTTAIRTPINTGALNVLRDLGAFAPDLNPYLVNYSDNNVASSTYTIRDAVVRAAGPVFSLPAGPITLTALVEQRKEILDPYVADTFTGTTTTRSVIPGRDQRIDSGYLEAQVPFVSNANAVAGVKSLDMQLAIRRDDYETTGASNNVTATARNKVGSTDPTLGLRYSPVGDVMFRASYGTGFLPPSVAQLVPTVPTNVTITGLVDPRRNNEPVTSYTRFSGGNPDLRPEESQSWSAGMVFTPRFSRGPAAFGGLHAHQEAGQHQRLHLRAGGCQWRRRLRGCGRACATRRGRDRGQDHGPESRPDQSRECGS